MNDPEMTLSTNRAGLAASKTLKRATDATQPIALAQHTPGPWTADKLGGIEAPTGHGYPQLVAITNCDPLTGETREANARLIAAAPDMLGALQMMARSFAVVGDGIFPNEARRIRAAIAKATGGKS